MSKTNLEKEDLLAKAEDYMVRGYDRPSELSQLLGVAYNTAKGYIEVVRRRWELGGTPEERALAKAELIRKAEEVAKEAWLLKSDAKNVSEKVSALRTILQAIERLTKLQGLDSPQAEEALSMSLAFREETKISRVADEIRKLPKAQQREARALIDKASGGKPRTDATALHGIFKQAEAETPYLKSLKRPALAD